MIRIIGVGDIMPGGLLSDSDQPCVEKEVLDLLLEGDIRCGTLECAFGNSPTFDEEKVADRGNVIYAKDKDICRLKEMHIDVVTLANNHFFDLGTKGARHTVELLESEGILHCGAGDNLEEASKPAVVEINGKKIAFVGFCDTEYSHVYWCTYATEDTPGVNPMTKKHVVEVIKNNALLYDYVVVLAHWGSEHTFTPNVSTNKMARLMLDAGACLVLGSHPHRIQPIINTKKGSIVYSMGNFLFPERLIAPPKVTWYPDGPIDYSSLPITEGYPKVKCVTLKTLPFWARVGLIVRSTLDESDPELCAVSNYSFSYLNGSNCISLLDNRESRIAKRKIVFWAMLIRSGFFRPYMFLRRVFFALFSRIKRIIK